MTELLQSQSGELLSAEKPEKALKHKKIAKYRSLFLTRAFFRLKRSLSQETNEVQEMDQDLIESCEVYSLDHAKRRIDSFDFEGCD